MTVKVEDLQVALRAEDEELPIVQLYLTQANAFVNTFINKEDIVMTDSQEELKDAAIMFVATDWYLHRDTGHSHSSFDQYTGLNSILDTLRKPGI